MRCWSVWAKSEPSAQNATVSGSEVTFLDRFSRPYQSCPATLCVIESDPELDAVLDTSACTARGLTMQI